VAAPLASGLMPAGGVAALRATHRDQRHTM
jgi:hypothetical protein